MGRGRPCGFDRDAALRQALDVFWTAGYDGATMAMLKAAMGDLCAPSVYAAYGSKEALFESALALYLQEHHAPLWARFEQTRPLQDALRELLRSVAILYSSPGLPRGCLVDLSTLNFSPSSQAVQAHLRALRHEKVEFLRRRLQQAGDDGELPAGVDAAALSTFYATILQGLSIQARDGAGRDQLLRVAELAMAAWDTPAG